MTCVIRISWWYEYYTEKTFQSSLLFLLVLSEDQNPQLMFLELGAFKGSPNSRGILNWIIEILHYYYRKQHKNIENSQIIEQNLVIFLSLSVLLSVDYGLRFLRLPSSRVFSVLKRHKWSFVNYIVPFFWSEMLSLANYHFLHK